MKGSTKFFAAAAVTTALALASVAYGHPGDGTGPGWGPGMGWGMGPGMGMGGGPGMGMGGGWGGGGPGMMGSGPGGATERLAALKTQLKITPAQEGPWKAYETVVTQQATAMQALRDKFRAEWQGQQPGAAPDVSAHRAEMLALRESGWKAQEKARADLAGVLTPEQQALIAGGGWGPRGMHRW